MRRLSKIVGAPLPQQRSVQDCADKLKKRYRLRRELAAIANQPYHLRLNQPCEVCVF
jgi:hypothetical protein